MLKVCIVGLLLKLAIYRMISKVLLVGSTRGLIEGIGATCHIITESATCEEGWLWLRSDWEKVC
jgi:hypothetical protein